ncbi:universal stress protein [Actinomadura formosensis]|uniref:universal stress protein n=1 Tax=Actinomadura formosensis TaxID=60706 RepID=UPI0008376DAA|nr:universal stress protein [Actinomadura formosensis]
MRHSPGPVRILVGVDGSPASLSALRWAAGEAKQRHAEIVAVRSWRCLRDRTAPYAMAAHRPCHDRERERTRHALAADVRAVLGAEPPVRVHQELAYGDPVRTLLHLAAKADLLVLGDAPAADGGPIRMACRRMSPCPVVLVPPGPVAAQDADAPAAGTTATGQCAW